MNSFDNLDNCANWGAIAQNKKPNNEFLQKKDTKIMMIEMYKTF